MISIIKSSSRRFHYCNQNAIVIGDSDVDGDFTLTSNGDITDAGIVNVVMLIKFWFKRHNLG